MFPAHIFQIAGCFKSHNSVPGRINWVIVLIAILAFKRSITHCEGISARRRIAVTGVPNE